mmetsp:Transcript_22474/g.75879  ORF Transcript_22474/g.75879 Transcript_22474/m.75879 type:complete len:203 (+) Transcript_22474:314-922(+)
MQTRRHCTDRSHDRGLLALDVVGRRVGRRAVNVIVRPGRRGRRAHLLAQLREPLPGGEHHAVDAVLARRHRLLPLVIVVLLLLVQVDLGDFDAEGGEVLGEGARVLGLRALREHPRGLDGVAVVEDEVEILDLGEARLEQLLEVVEVADDHDGSVEEAISDRLELQLGGREGELVLRGEHAYRGAGMRGAGEVTDVGRRRVR